MRLAISIQYYPTHTGERPMSFAIWLVRPFRRRKFLAYAWSLSAAWRAAYLIAQDNDL